MYLNDSSIRHLLAIFFAIGISEEITVLLGMPIPILSLIYSVGILLIIFNFTRLKKYVWPPGLGIIGIFALVYFIFLLIGYGSGFFRNLSSIISIIVWIRSINYLSEDSDGSEYDEINELDEDNK